MRKPVSSTVYDKEYYLYDCTDDAAFRKSYGAKLGPRLAMMLRGIKVTSGEKILDIGCGRGETLIWGAKQKGFFVGIDYSRAALNLARLAVAKSKLWPRSSGLSLLRANGRRLPFKKNSFDKIFLFDVVEHLFPWELKELFSESHRVLKADGQLFIRTAPNKFLVDFTYPFWIKPLDRLLLWFWSSLTGRRYPQVNAQMRTAKHRQVHVNEMTYWKLNRALNRAGFKPRFSFRHFNLKPHLSYKDRLYNVLVGLYPFSLKPPLIYLFALDIMVEARKK